MHCKIILVPKELPRKIIKTTALTKQLLNDDVKRILRRLLRKNIQHVLLSNQSLSKFLKISFSADAFMKSLPRL